MSYSKISSSFRHSSTMSFSASSSTAAGEGSEAEEEVKEDRLILSDSCVQVGDNESAL